MKQFRLLLARLQNNAGARIYTQKCIKLQYVGCVECELVFVYTQAVLFSVCCHVETRPGLRAELKGIQRRLVIFHVYLELTIPVCVFNAES